MTVTHYNLSLDITVESDGAVRATLSGNRGDEDESVEPDCYTVDPHTAVQQYCERFVRVRERNPDVDGETVRNIVLEQWMREVAQ